MRRRIHTPEPELSLVERAEYGLTALLVFVVIVAILELCGFHIGFRG